MDRSDQPTEFRESVRQSSPWRVLLVVGVAVLVVGAAVAARVTERPRPVVTPPPAAVSPAPQRAPAPSLAVAPSPTDDGALPFIRMVAPASTTELQATGVLVAETADAAAGALVPDTDGTVWTTRGELLVRFDPQTGRAQTWSVADDPVLATASLARSDRGGVWLIDDATIRLFDGVRFVVTIATPSRIRELAGSNDGTLWAVTDARELLRWQSDRWAGPPLGRPDANVASLLVDRSGRVWTSDFPATPERADGFTGISMWDGVTWTRFSPELLGIDVSGPPTLLEGEDGSVWATRGFLSVRFDGRGWERLEPDPTGMAAMSLQAVDAEGRLWALTSGCEGCDGIVRVYFGTTWTTFPDERGAPGPGAGPPPAAFEQVGAARFGGGWDGRGGGPMITVRNGQVVASTAAGLAVLAFRTWREVPLRGAADQVGPVGRLTAMAAISTTEAWAATVRGGGGRDTALYRWDTRTWHREALPVEAAVHGLAVGGDGTLWAATTTGPMVRRDGTWIDLGALVGESIPSAFRGPSCQGPAIHVDHEGTAYFLGPRSAGRVVAIRAAGGRWTARPITGPVRGSCGAADIAVIGSSDDPVDNQVWLLDQEHHLLRWDPGEREWVPGAPSLPGEACLPSAPSALALDAGGQLWSAGSLCNGDGLGEGLFQFDGERWTRVVDDSWPWPVSGLAFLPSGEPITVGRGIAIHRFEPVRRLTGLSLRRVSIGRDGSVWVAGSNVYQLPRPLDDLPQ